MKLKMKLTKTKPETHDTKTLTLESAERPDFKPGQFFIAEFTRPEKIPKRSYSASSSPTKKGVLEFTVKAVQGGIVSNLLNGAKPGEEFIVDGPYGHFFFDEKEMPQIVMLGAGSGIAPFRSICRYIIDKKLKTKATLVYCSRTLEDIICHDELIEFSKKMKGLKLVISLSREEREGYHFGRIDDAMVKGITAKNKGAFYFICGPPQMVSGTEGMLLANGIAKERIKSEKYG
ncbi:Sulfhydrogenase 1 subunit gamma [uncultured archaeon]|nr:Sulfhydrogenase 1 subunit gamma [uncultured archaeon]